MAELHAFDIDIVTLQLDGERREPGLQINFKTTRGEKGSISMALPMAGDFELEFRTRLKEAVRQSASAAE